MRLYARQTLPWWNSLRFWALLLVPHHSNVLVHTDPLESLQNLRRGASLVPLLDQLSQVTWRHVFSRSISLRLSFLPGN